MSVRRLGFTLVVLFGWMGALGSAPVAAQTWAAPWPYLEGPEEPWHPDPPQRADESSHQLAAGPGDELRLAFVGTRHGALDVFAQRTYGLGTVVRAPLIRPHQDRGAFRQTEPRIAAGISGLWWVVWSDARRGVGEDLLIRTYQGDTAQANEFAVSNLAIPARRVAAGIVELPPDRLLVGWSEDGAQGRELKTHMLGIFGTSVFPESVLRDASIQGTARDLALRSAGSSVFARAFWIDDRTGEPALVSVALDGAGGPMGSPVFLRSGVRAFDVAWDGEAWFVATLRGPEGERRTELFVERLAADLSSVWLEPTFVRRVSADRIGIAVHDGHALLTTWSDSSRRRPELLRGRLEVPRRWQRIRLPKDARGPVRLVGQETAFGLAWSRALAPARQLVCARLPHASSDVDSWSAVEDGGAADQRIDAIGSDASGSPFVLCESEIAEGTCLFVGRGRQQEPLAVSAARRVALDPRLTRAEDGTHLVTWREEREGRPSAGRVRWLDSAAVPTGRILSLDRGRSHAPAGRSLALVRNDAVWFLRERDRDGTWHLELEVRDRRSMRVLSNHLLAVATAGDVLRAEVFSALGDGAIVAWQRGPVGQENVYLQRLDATGQPLGVSHAANEAPGARRARIGVLDGFVFAVVWEQGEAPNGDVRLRTFTQDLVPRAPSLRITDAPAGEQDGVEVDVLPGRGWVVCWEDDAGGLDAIHMRTFDAMGMPSSSVHRVHEGIGGVIPDRVSPRIHVDGTMAWIGWMDRRRSLGFDVYVTRARLVP
ncbi:MAG: hypothetical protein H6833_13105 [Planctomycetes bacterium]|nr:hypothetical protein [Planctomycetota bacterium]